MSHAESRGAGGERRRARSCAGLLAVIVVVGAGVALALAALGALVVVAVHRAVH